MTQRKLTIRDHAAVGLLVLGSMFVVATLAIAILGVASTAVFIIGLVLLLVDGMCPFQFTDLGAFGYLALGSTIACVVVLLIGVAMLRVGHQLGCTQGESDET